MTSKTRRFQKPLVAGRTVGLEDPPGAFGPAAIGAVNGTELIHLWLDHLLVLSMLQHPDQLWSWGRFVVVHPAGNTDLVAACDRYHELLVDPSTFSSLTVEDLLDADHSRRPPRSPCASGTSPPAPDVPVTAVAAK